MELASAGSSLLSAEHDPPPPSALPGMGWEKGEGIGQTGPELSSDVSCCH